MQKGERATRLEVIGIIDNTEKKSAPTKEVIRKQLLSEIEKEVDLKLRYLEDNEILSLVYRIDIINEDNEIRNSYSRNSKKYKDWRKKVFERDNYQCVICGSKGSMNAHHIKKYSTHEHLRFDLDNGQTLCLECHAIKHPHLGIINHGKR